MSVLIVFNRDPYDGTDVTWNGLRLAGRREAGLRGAGGRKAEDEQRR